MIARLRVTPLGAAHDRGAFHSRSEPLNRYLREQASQDVRRRLSTCLVAVDAAGGLVGDYTLSARSVPLDKLDARARRKLPNYEAIPVILGRLAIDERFVGKGYGAALLADSIQRALRTDLAAYAMFTQAKDEQAARFYRHHGFVESPDDPLQLRLALATAASLIGP